MVSVGSTWRVIICPDKSFSWTSFQKSSSFDFRWNEISLKLNLKTSRIRPQMSFAGEDKFHSEYVFSTLSLSLSLWSSCCYWIFFFSISTISMAEHKQLYEQTRQRTKQTLVRIKTKIPFFLSFKKRIRGSQFSDLTKSFWWFRKLLTKYSRSLPTHLRNFRNRANRLNVSNIVWMKFKTI